ncbi:flagellar hook assembly protein FlgD [Roseococcus pinisoli]|uniref:Basal-body rod modification protein FlgD n=1 Tax=Roseococcus pinisoli TaxID=2835040 RepID=A0ABS5QA49_9PROT|nr:flagellar hook capping FlgD N-terminal domain-containing protein [Roseococcus pinisoli]MBS7810582.1 flagellar hook assembly protein FlgD [Roseococcus pinisoli]
MSGAINGTTGAGGGAAARGATSGTGLGADFNTFLTLLTTQLRHQDPTNAMDPNEMTRQLVQFAGVEQQITTNNRLQTLISVQQGSQLVAAAPLMGRMVEVESDHLSLQGGQAVLRLPPAGEARRVGIGVLDAQGNLIRTAQVDLGAVPTEWSWDGADASGARRPDGAYTYVLAGATLEGSRVAVTGTVLGRATGVERRDGEVRLNLGALTVSFDKLRGLAGGS